MTNELVAILNQRKPEGYAAAVINALRQSDFELEDAQTIADLLKSGGYVQHANSVETAIKAESVHRDRTWATDPEPLESAEAA